MQHTCVFFLQFNIISPSVRLLPRSLCAHPLRNSFLHVNHILSFSLLLISGRELEQDEHWKAANCKRCPSCHRAINYLSGCDLMKCGDDYHGGNVQVCGAIFVHHLGLKFCLNRMRNRRVKSTYLIAVTSIIIPGNDLQC